MKDLCVKDAAERAAMNSSDVEAQGVMCVMMCGAACVGAAGALASGGAVALITAGSLTAPAAAVAIGACGGAAVACASCPDVFCNFPVVVVMTMGKVVNSLCDVGNGFNGLGLCKMCK